VSGECLGVHQLPTSHLLDLAAGAGAERLSARRVRPADAPLAGAARDFESVLLHKLMEEMRRTVPESGLLGGGGVSQQVQGMFWYYLSQEMAQSGGIGLWKGLCEQFTAGAAPERAAAGPAGGAVEESR